jgi:hypothetical protein
MKYGYTIFYVDSVKETIEFSKRQQQTINRNLYSCKDI